MSEKERIFWKLCVRLLQQFAQGLYEWKVKD